MKRLLPIGVFLAAVVGLASAQDSTNAPAAPPAAANIVTNGEVTIESESLKAVFTNKMLVAVYRGNVRVHHPRWWFRSEVMTTSFPAAGKRIESLVLESNVFIVSLDEKGRTNTARGDRAVYDHKIIGGTTNELMVLIGRPATVDTPDFTMESDRIDGDLRNGTFDGGPNPRMKIKAQVLGNSTNNPIFNPLQRP